MFNREVRSDINNFQNTNLLSLCQAQTFIKHVKCQSQTTYYTALQTDSYTFMWVAIKLPHPITI